MMSQNYPYTKVEMKKISTSAITNRPSTFITRDNNVRDNLLYEIAITYSIEL